MSIYLIPSQKSGIANNTSPLALPNDALPKDMWEYILHIIASLSRLPHIAELSLTCKFFRKFFYDKCAQFRGHILLNRIKALPSFKSDLLSEVGPKMTQLLSSTEGGRQFFRSPSNLSILYILGPGTDKKFHLETLDMCSLLKDKVDASFVTWQAQRIIACYPNQDGFIVVTISGASIWKYEKEVPVFQRFVTPFHTFNLDQCRLETSGYKNGCLVVRQSRLSHQNNWWVINLRKTSSEFKSAEPDDLEKLFSNLVCCGDKIFFTRTSIQENFLQEIEIEKKQKQEIRLLNKESPLYIEVVDSQYVDILPINSDRWILYNFRSYLQLPYSSSLCVIDAKNKGLWIGPEKEIKFQRLLLGCGSLVFLNNDFLFVSYPAGNFRAIYLPTKKDYTSKLQHLLNGRLKSGLTIYAIDFSIDKKDGLVFSVVLQNNKTYALHEFKFFLEKPLISEMKTATPTCVKVMCVVGAIMLLLGIAAYFSLRQFQFASAVQMGMSALVAGSAIGSALIAIGCYKHWKRSLNS